MKQRLAVAQAVMEKPDVIVDITTDACYTIVVIYRVTTFFDSFLVIEESRQALTAFKLYEGIGEWFGLSKSRKKECHLP